MSLHVDIHHRFMSSSHTFELAVSFTAQSQRIALLGPSGSGKSLTLRAIAGLLRPTQGHIQIGNEIVFDSASRLCKTPAQRRVGYLFQQYALFPHLTVAQNIVMGVYRGWWNCPRRRAKDLAAEWLDMLDLRMVADLQPHQISGGQLQRTAMARALATRPDTLLLDEPFSALDAPLRQQLRDELGRLQRRHNMRVILITHDPLDVTHLADEVFDIRHGRIT